MNVNKGKSVLAILGVAAATAFSGSALAQAQQDRGFYVGGSLGKSIANDWCDTSDFPAGFGLRDCKDEDTAWKAFVGYRVIRNLAVEASYLDFGKYSATITSGGASVGISTKTTAWSAAAVGILPLGDFGLFGKLGFAYIEAKESTARLAGTTILVGDKGTELHYGLGATYNFTKNLGLRAEWERVNDAEVDMLSVGVQYRF